MQYHLFVERLIGFCFHTELLINSITKKFKPENIETKAWSTIAPRKRHFKLGKEYFRRLLVITKKLKVLTFDAWKFYLVKIKTFSCVRLSLIEHRYTDITKQILDISKFQTAFKN